MSEWTKDRDVRERVARALASHHPRGFDGLSQWGQERYLDDARVAMKALEAERDEAYAKGWEDAKAAALAVCERERGFALPCDRCKFGIRAIEPRR